jgi:hypothetical protein
MANEDALRARIEELESELALFMKASSDLYYGQLISPEVCARIEDIEDDDDLDPMSDEWEADEYDSIRGDM